MKIVLLIVFLPLACFSQQDPLSGLYWHNYAHYNPSTSGLENKYDGYASYRNQWQGVNGAPEEFFFNANANIKDRHGIGLNYQYDKIGFTNNQDLNINYNYQLLLKGQHKISMGIAAGIQKYKLDPDWVVPQTLNDPTLPEAETSFDPNFNAGIAYSSQVFLLGSGITHINQRKVVDYYNRRLHSYFHARVKLAVGHRSDLNKKAYIFVSSLVRTDWVKTAADFDLRFLILKKRLWIGAGYRNTKTLKAHIAWEIKERYRIAYGFENYLNSISEIDWTTHEISLGLIIPHQIEE